MGLRTPRGLSGATPAPTAPSNFTATPISDSEVTLAWTDNAATEDSYQIIRNSAVIAVANANTTSYSDTGLAVNTAYGYSLRALRYVPSANVTANATTTVYQYGYPAYVTAGTEPNVAAQWTFSEASGDIIDEVADLTLVDTGSPTYEVAATGNYAGLTPGITCGSGNYFLKAGETSLAIGTSDFVLEYWFKASTWNNGIGVGLSTSSAATAQGIFMYSATANKLALWLRATDNTLATFEFHVATPSNLADGNLHKVRVAGNRTTGLAHIYINGAVVSVLNISTLAGKSIPCHNVMIGTAYEDGSGTENTATYYEVRLTLGNATNNSGGPGGG